MLVLTRKLNERIMIGDDIEIVVVNVGEEKVQLGINAPRSIPVHRREVYEEILRENLAASRSKIPSIDSLCGLKIQPPADVRRIGPAIEGPSRPREERRHHGEAPGGRDRRRRAR
jgi:carbon storage regulator